MLPIIKRRLRPATNEKPPLPLREPEYIMKTTTPFGSKKPAVFRLKPLPEPAPSPRRRDTN